MLRCSVESRSGGSHNPWDENTVAQMLDQVAAEHPHATAAVEGERSVTFEQLRATRDRLCSELVRQDVTDGTRVAVRISKGLDYMVLLHALWRVGAIAIPLNAMWTGREVERALDETSAEVLIMDTSTDTSDWLPVISHLGLPTDGLVASSRLAHLTRVIDISRIANAVWRPRHAQALAEPAEVPASTRQESLLLFTSGSSSTPKAVVLRQDGLLGTAYYFGQSLRMGAGDKFLSLGPYFHAGGIVQMLLANQIGAAQYVFRRVDIPTIAAVALNEGCTVVTGFDPVLLKLIDAIESLGGDLPFHTVAAAPAHDVFETLQSRGIRVVTMYALTEGGNMVTLGSQEGQSLTNGHPLPGVSVRVCDSDGRALGPEQVGEICFKGWNLFRGYHNVSNDGSRLATDADHYFHTGDIGRLDQQGRLVYLGRSSSMIKTAGENVSATEVEAFLVSELPQVTAAAVVGVPSEDWGEAVVAFVELVPGAPPFEESWLKDACRGKLAGYKIPKRFIEVAAGEWPIAETGKLSRVSLVERFQELQQSEATRTGLTPS